MKNFLSIIFLCFVFSAVKAQIPNYDSVAYRFYHTYKTDPELYYHLIKTAKGYEIYTSDWEETDKSASKIQLFYSFSSQKFKKLHFKKLKSKEKSEGIESSGIWFGNRYNYERCPYFGYPQWSWDVIRDYAGRDNLTDRELEGLSRAYQNYAQGYVWGNQTQFLANAQWPSRNFNPENTEISSKNIDSFLIYRELEFQVIQKLVARNPNYAVIVGTISNKLANEYVDIAIILDEYGYREKAIEYLRKVEYDNTVMTAARNLLNAAPDSTILITDGDNDTYPLYYLQLEEHYRQDVTVVNLALLASPAYSRLLTSEKSLFGHFKADYYSKFSGNFHSRYGYTTSEESDSVCSASTLLNHFYREINPGDYDEFPCDMLEVPYLNGKIQYSLPPFYHAGQVMLLDLLQSNHRSVCFSNTAPAESANFRSIREIGNVKLIDLTDTTFCDSSAVCNWYHHIFIPPKVASNVNPETDGTLYFYNSGYARQLGIAIAWSAKNEVRSETDKLVSKAMNMYPDGQLHPNDNWSDLAGGLVAADYPEQLADICKYLMKSSENTQTFSMGTRPALGNNYNPLEQLSTIAENLSTTGKYPELELRIVQFLNSRRTP